LSPCPILFSPLCPSRALSASYISSFLYLRRCLWLSQFILFSLWCFTFVYTYSGFSLSYYASMLSYVLCCSNSSNLLNMKTSTTFLSSLHPQYSYVKFQIYENNLHRTSRGQPMHTRLTNNITFHLFL